MIEVGVPYRERPAPEALKRWVECSWSIEPEQPIAEYAVAPDGCFDIIYTREEGLRAIGTMTVEQRYELRPGADTVGLRFRPGMAGAFLRTAPVELTDAAAPLVDLWGRAARELEARLEDAEAPEALLRAQLEAPAGAPNGVQRAIEEIVAGHGNVDLEYIARQANLSARQFRRRCLEESGLTPKHLCRVLRFRRASRLAQGVLRPQWSGIAADAGYFDQAHLIRDFREFTGRTPVAVFSHNADRGRE
jgi:AraC-like DNA-binding protein